MEPSGTSIGIGALSARTGCNIETIRYYERIGILPRPGRTMGGHRLYTLDHIMRLWFVWRARELGFSLEEVRALLALADARHRKCTEVRESRRHDQLVARVGLRVGETRLVQSTVCLALWDYHSRRRA